MPAASAAPERGTLVTALPLLLLATLAITGGAAAANLAGQPKLLALALALTLSVVTLVMVARRMGIAVMWVGLALVSIMAGEMSSVSLGGQNGHLLYADLVIGVGAVIACARNGLTIEVPRAPLLDRLWPLLGWCALTLIVAGDPLTAVAELKEWMVAGVLGIGAVIAASDARRARLLLAAVAITGVMIAAGMIGVALTSPMGAPLAIMRKLVDLPWGRTNYLAGLLIVAIPVLLGLMGDAASWRGRAVCALGLVITMAGLAVSASKGAIVALAVGVLLTFGLSRRQTLAPRLIVLVVFGLATAMFVAGPLHQVIEMRLQTSALDYSAGERMDLYSLAWQQFITHPVLGIGLNDFSVVSHRLHGLDTVPHNLEFGFLAELGLPGLLLVLAWVWAMGDGARRALRAAVTPRERSLALGMLAAFIAFAVHNQVESTLYGQQYKMLLVVQAAAAWSIAGAWEMRNAGAMGSSAAIAD